MVAPARGATMLKKQIIPIVRAFQSALPRGERQQIGGSPDEDRNISIHAPTRGATFKDCYRLLCWIFQSTLPRGERQYFHFCSKMLKKISIHAPTRGATTFPGTFRSTYNYFNPRSHEGSDRRYHRPERDPLFQSTLPRGERLLVMLSAYMS